MRSVTLLVVYLVVVFVGGGLMAPWLALGLSGLGEVWPWLAGLVDHPFHRYVHRSLLLMGVMGMWPLVRVAGMSSWADVGLRRSGGVAARFGMGLLTGMVVLSGIGLMAVLLGAREWDPGRSGGTLTVLMRAGSAGLAVGFLEELLFRGVVFGLLLKSMRLRPALVAGGVIFAALHFLGRPAEPGELRWWSGLAVVGEMLSGIADGAQWIPAGVTLTLFGMLLAVCYWRTGDLFFSVGLHAGLVFTLKVYGSVTSGVAGSALWFWGSKQWMDGWLAALAMGVLWWTCNRVIRRREWGRAMGGEPEPWRGETTPTLETGGDRLQSVSCAVTRGSGGCEEASG